MALVKKTNAPAKRTRKANVLTGRALGLFRDAIADLGVANDLLTQQASAHDAEAVRLVAAAALETSSADRCVATRIENQSVIDKLNDLVGGGEASDDVEPF